MAPAHGQDAHAAEVGRAVASARQAALAALARCRTQHGMRGEYTDAVLGYGSALRTGALLDAAALWEAEGLGDGDIAAARHEVVELAAAYTETVNEWAAAFAACNRATDHLPDGFFDAETAPPEVAALYRHKDEVMERRSAASVAHIEAVKALRETSARRNELFSQALMARLAVEREMGGTAPATYRTRLSAADKAMLGDVMEMFPTQMSAHANAGNLPVNISRATGKRAHYTSKTFLKTSTPRHGLLFPPPDVLPGSPELGWSAEATMGSMEEFLTKPRGPGVGLGRMGWGDTPENRATLQALIEDGTFNQVTARMFESDRARSARRRKGGAVKNHTARATVVSTGRGLGIAVEAVDTVTHRGSTPSARVQFSDRRSMTHEFGHFMEFNNPDVYGPCVEFRERRSGGVDAKRVRYGGTARKPEYVVEGGFVTPYIGRVYEGNAGGHTEVFSVAVESMLVPRTSGALLGGDVSCDHSLPYTATRDGRRVVDFEDPPTRDEEHFNLVLGILATANRHVPDTLDLGSGEVGAG